MVWDTLGSWTLAIIALISCHNWWPSPTLVGYWLCQKNKWSITDWARSHQDLCDKSSQVFPEHDLSSTSIFNITLCKAVISYQVNLPSPHFLWALNKIHFCSVFHVMIPFCEQLYQSKMGLEAAKPKKSDGLSPTLGFPFEKLLASHSAGETYHRPVMVCRSLVWGSWSSVQLLQGDVSFAASWNCWKNATACICYVETCLKLNHTRLYISE